MDANGVTPAKLRIFISYRRGDTEHPVGRLVEDLRKHFEHGQVFQDIASIDPGADFVEALNKGLDDCAAVLVVIGPAWLTVTDREGRRRLELSDDWVRHEVAESLKRPGVRVFPVLLDTDMPSAEQLPETLQPLTRRQAFPLTARHWRNDVATLVEILRKVPGLERTPAPEAKPSRGSTRVKRLAAATAALTALVIGTPVAIQFLNHLTNTRDKPIAESPPKAVATATTGETFRDCAQCPELVVIPTGEFTMGSPAGEAGRYPNEGPQHKVSIARPFAAGKYEVTFDEWDACVAAGGCTHKPGDEGWGRSRQPVINVSWEDAQAYLSWLSKRTRKPYRLLSEAEWEYAARAGTTTRYPWGDEPGTNRANFRLSGSKWSGRRTAPVGSFDANQFGLHDMIGNVFEWVQDCWNNSYKSAPGDGRAWESGDCGQRIARGGTWDFIPDIARAASRLSAEPGGRGSALGFRVARTL